jgi:hypothetical protein
MSTNPFVLIEQLSAFKASGMSPAAAAAALMAANPGAGPSAEPGGISPFGALEAAFGLPGEMIGANDLSQVLVEVFGGGLTAGELASILHARFPDLPALGLARAVLAGLPNTSKTDIDNALTGCGIPASDALGAVNILYPATVTIQANQAWQATGVTVTGQQSTTLTCEGGSWTANPANGMCGANGDPGFVAKDGYTLPGAAEGAVIGRIGANPPFLVGALITKPPGQSGMLSLCINDDLNGRYGAGLTDNTGALTFTITTAAPS